MYHMTGRPKWKSLKFPPILDQDNKSRAEEYPGRFAEFSATIKDLKDAHWDTLQIPFQFTWKSQMNCHRQQESRETGHLKVVMASWTASWKRERTAG